MPESFLNKVAGLGLHRCFPMKFAKFLRTPFLQKHLQTTASQNKFFFSEKQMGIQFKRISHQITKFVEFFVQKGYHIYYNSIVTENI